MEKIFINGKTNGYSAARCGKTLTAGELIDILQGYDEDVLVYLRNEDGYTYGNITQYDVYSSNDLEY